MKVMEREQTTLRLPPELKKVTGRSGAQGYYLLMLGFSVRTTE